MRELPKHWIQYDDSLLDALFNTTFQLFDLNLSMLNSQLPLLSSPFAYMTLIDRDCTWFQHWMRKSWARKAIGTSISKTNLTRKLIHVLMSHVEEDLESSTLDYSRIKGGIFSYLLSSCENKSRCMDQVSVHLYIHSLVLLGNLPLYSETITATTYNPLGTCSYYFCDQNLRC